MSHRALALAIALAASVMPIARGPVHAAGPTELAIVVERDPGSVARVARTIQRLGYQLDRAPLWSEPGHDLLHLARPARGAVDSAQALRTVRGLAGVRLAAEVSARTSHRLELAGETIRVRFRTEPSASELRAWGRFHRLDAIGRGVDRRSWIFAPSSSVPPGRRARRVPGPTVDAFERLPITIARTPDTRPVYHEWLEERALGLVLESWAGGGTPLSAEAAQWARTCNVSTIDDVIRCIVEDEGGALGLVGPKQLATGFPQQDNAERAIGRLDELPEIAFVGPLLTRDPFAVLVRQIVVRFPLGTDVESLSGALDKLELDLVRALPYVPNGHVVQSRTPASLSLYDAAAALLSLGAVAAVPSLYVEMEPQSGGSSWPHLETIFECGASPSSSDDPPIGLLDSGIHGQYPLTKAACDPLDVEVAIDITEVQSPEAVCTVDHPSWCDSSCKTVWSGWTGTSHATQMGATMTAEEQHGLRGVAPGSKLINARYDTDLGMTTIRFSDTLWWIAGGSPTWCHDGTEYKCPHDPSTNLCTASLDCSHSMPEGLERGATVINLSVARPNFTTALCTTPLCKIVCKDASACDPTHDVIAAVTRPRTTPEFSGVRGGGVLVVNSIGVEGTPGAGGDCICWGGGACTSISAAETDLAEHADTLAVGSVAEHPDLGDWYPFFPSSGRRGSTDACLIQWPLAEADVVAPLGRAGSLTTLCDGCMDHGLPVRTGDSSAAAAAVSGVAALLFRAAPDLTAVQAACIIRNTARPRHGTGEPWENLTGSIPECTWDTGTPPRNRCVGHGMVDGCAAIEMATACSSSPFSEACPCPPPFKIAFASTMDGCTLRFQLPGPSLVLPTLTVLRCALLGDCLCDGRRPIVSLDLVNSSEVTLETADVRLCVDGACRSIGQESSWKPGARRSVVVEPVPEVLEAMRHAESAVVEIVPIDGKEAR